MEARAALTVKAIEAAPPGAELRDGAAPGLCVRISARSRVFRWYLTSEGRAITIGRWSKVPQPGHLTLGEARMWLERLKAGRQAGRLADVEAELAKLNAHRGRATLDAGPLTVNAVAADFMTFVERERKRPDQVRRPLDCDILPAIGARPIAAVTQRECRRIVDSVVGRGSTRQAGVVLATLKQLFNFAIERGDLEANPAGRFRSNSRALGITNNISQRFLNADELAAFWRALDAYHGLTPTVRASLKLLLLTGVRTSELLQARVGEVDFAAKAWTIPVAHQKLTKARARTARPFVVPLAPTALELFEELAALARSLRSEYVAASPHAATPGAPLTEKSLGHAMRRMFEGPKPLLAFQGERPTPHDLRRTVRTHLGETIGVQWHLAERCLNHALPKIAATYDVADYLDERRAALERWGEYIARLVDPALKNVVPLKAAGAR